MDEICKAEGNSKMKAGVKETLINPAARRAVSEPSYSSAFPKFFARKMNKEEKQRMIVSAQE